MDFNNKEQTEENYTFYEFLDFLIKNNSEWLTSRAKKALSHKEYLGD